MKKEHFLQTWLTVLLVFVFLFMSIGGDILHWMSNQVCYRYLGCNIGFFGYDALVHFVSGLGIVAVILWLTRSKTSVPNPLLHWRHPLVLIALAALAGVSWEFLEYCFDHYRMFILHQNLFVPFNRMSQPTNSDTMGDLTFGIIGASFVAIVSWWHSKKTNSNNKL